MKTIIFTACLFCMIFLLPSSVMAADACKIVLCLYGKTTGNSGGNECQSAERSFFKIVKKNRHGFQPNRTADARRNLLIECKSAEPKIIDQIINKFGRVRN
ncbi:conjugal transfer protein [Atlantibacter subterranea]|uniref:Conjugal transfer protein n=1 Tax=Atlantibacter subterraneus TaxID=255519 RepID=A0A427V960_9ENTR|nr:MULTISPECIES: TrbM/KikA/MpfK family conjugal transfer protein [Enterobacteriaceae]EKQ7210347.1 conjugal transfer protein [Citrobacter freundii]RSB64479.1 conjugal transfer protein [Atlantibacter subterranea]RSE07731.1 conjugal transfer protein [Atlantibacter subterranea]RSE29283.1 conjugal transfer protein [Atlantibacter subterranea]RYH33430.1 conjugal transfer protein [Citrobacter freundii]